jgi:hypothetical protein
MELAKLVGETREFIRTEVLPIDDEFDGDIEAAGVTSCASGCSRPPANAACCRRMPPPTWVASS